MIAVEINGLTIHTGTVGRRAVFYTVTPVTRAVVGIAIKHVMGQQACTAGVCRGDEFSRHGIQTYAIDIQHARCISTVHTDGQGGDVLQPGQGREINIPGLPHGARYIGWILIIDNFGAVDLDIELAIRGKDSLGPQGDVFFGNADLFVEESLTLSVKLPHGSWQLAAVPKQGWQQQAPQRWLIRGLSLAILTITLFLLRSWRIRHRSRRQRRETLHAAFEHSLLGVLLSNDQGSVEYINKTFKKP